MPVKLKSKRKIPPKKHVKSEWPYSQTFKYSVKYLNYCSIMQAKANLLRQSFIVTGELTNHGLAFGGRDTTVGNERRAQEPISEINMRTLESKPVSWQARVLSRLTLIVMMHEKRVELFINISLNGPGQSRLENCEKLNWKT